MFEEMFIFAKLFAQLFLSPIQSCIDSILGDQHRMSTRLNDLSVLYNTNDISISYSAQTMSNYYAGSFGIEFLLNNLLPEQKE